MDTNRIDWLFRKYFDAGCTEEERREFLELVAQGRQDQTLHQLLEEKLQEYAPDRKLDQLSADALFSNIMQKAAHGGPARVVKLNRRPPSYKWLVGIAVSLAVVSLNIWFWDKENYVVNGPQQAEVFKDTVHPVPGTNKAMLVLADGSIVALDSAGDGTIATQGHTKVLKQGAGELSYEAGAQSQTGEVQYNTLSTPYGGQYRIKLPDGSRVWLNAASSIRYPTAFTGKTRTVSVTGEAYFEVEKNTARPFVVQTGKMGVEVLGTHFNVNSYDDEPVTRTTLVEGSVRVSTAGAARDIAVLKPGEQAQWIQEDAKMNIRKVDVESVTAWKNGYFHFDGTPGAEVMRQVSRWYDVNIDINGKVGRHFRGMIPRNASLDEVLHMLSLTGEFKYKTDGRTVRILP
ncbi:FecR family protein [Pseudoflavitalea rhizosphaerae]|uniref:FecR family protein n=1 Tax=Pseudoflavitalea rhizosphaerae TaxID=1884793 RepID=UPI000F8E3755|nr:FecR family protein [Pseudoflavitalea rhizosphaerae]